MTGPKHLWSGNWEEESPASGELTERRLPARGPQPSTRPSEPKPSTRSAEPQPSTPLRPKRRRRAWIAAGTLLLAAVAAAIVLVTAGGSSKPAAAITPAAPAPSLANATTPTTVTPPGPSPPAVSWLGMELVTVPPGGATVETVRLGSAADRAGLSPGDVILAINNRPLAGTDGIATALKGLHAGDKVSLQITYGSAPYETTVTLGTPPTRYR